MSLSVAGVELAETSQSASHAEDPDHWLRRADEAMGLAKQMSDNETVEKMLLVAQEYLHLAERAAERLREMTPPGSRQPQDASRQRRANPQMVETDESAAPSA